MTSGESPSVDKSAEPTSGSPFRFDGAQRREGPAEQHILRGDAGQNSSFDSTSFEKLDRPQAVHDNSSNPQQFLLQRY